jgi:hypothetical protein
VPKKWQKQESRLAALIGGTRNAGSGNGWVRKSDVRNREWLVEAKQTDARSIRLKLDDLLANGHHADVEGRTPAFCVEIAGHNYVVLREQDWER